MKKLNLKTISITALSVLTFISCEKNTDSEQTTLTEEQAKAAPKMCTSYSENYLTSRTKGALLKNLKWENGRTIRIKFLNGDNFFHDKVKKYAIKWTKYANLTFQFVSSNENADIKIEFDDDGISRSSVGVQAESRSQTEASMHFGWFNNSTRESSFRATTIHEFGHALGLNHEHQNPVASIKWDKPAVYKAYAGAPNYWSKETVDHNLFKKLNRTLTNYSKYDPKSIMHYSIRKGLTLDGFNVGYNSNLSATDKSFIAKEYPKDGTGGGDIDNGGICDGIEAHNSAKRYKTGDKVIFNNYIWKLGRFSWRRMQKCN